MSKTKPYVKLRATIVVDYGLNKAGYEEACYNHKTGKLNPRNLLSAEQGYIRDEIVKLADDNCRNVFPEAVVRVKVVRK